VKPILSPAEMAAADKATIDAGTPSLDLMERAGAAVARAAVKMAGGAYGRRFVILSGKGNNGGDGFVAARKLAWAGAYPVVVFVEEPSQFKGDSRINFERLRGVRRLEFEPDMLRRELSRATVVVDAIFGTGFSGAASGRVAEAIEVVNASGVPILAVDIPSGVDGATGEVRGSAVSARATITMGALKTGLLLHPGSAHAGEVEVADIGISSELMRSQFRLVERTDVAMALLPRPPVAHKKSVGTVMVVAGSVGMSGAAALAARGALRAGAGLVTIAAPASVALQLDQSVAEALTLPLPETGNATIEASAVDAVLARAEQVDAVAVGPGLTTDPETVEFVRKLIAALDKPLVIDADALNALGGSGGVAAPRGTDSERQGLRSPRDKSRGSVGEIAERRAPTILTPHPGEIARLLNVDTAEVGRDRLGSARRAAALANAVVVLKGYRTIVAEPSGDAYLIATGGPALATGGTGDVLTGITATFLAAGLGTSQAAWCASWVHGRAGDLLAGRTSDRGVVAGDLPEALAEVLSELVWNAG
jgi:ADP-dependent NAD(P)H-hydrate dehydratase / NAD(P)H-hydrate epimerase